MRKLLILGVLVATLAIGLSAGVLMFGTGVSPMGPQKNVAEAAPIVPRLQVFVVCLNTSDGALNVLQTASTDIPRGDSLTLTTVTCTSIFGANQAATGGGYKVFPLDAKVDVTMSKLASGNDSWEASARR